jgi:hypothetical protein
LETLERSRIFLKEKPGWYDVPDDGRPNFERHETGFDESLEKWKRKEEVAKSFS